LGSPSGRAARWISRVGCGMAPNIDSRPVTDAIRTAGGRYVAARHEGGAICVADRGARATARVGIASLHQGPGLTNPMTGLAESSKSATPLLVPAGDTPGRGSRLELPRRPARPRRVGRRDRRAAARARDRRPRPAPRAPLPHPPAPAVSRGTLREGPPGAEENTCRN
jgi:hypothetical protein